MYIGLDIGGTKTAVLLTNKDQDPLFQTQYPTDKKDLTSSLIHIIKKTLDDADVPVQQLAGIGLGVPGIVNTVNGEINVAINLDISHPTPLIKPLEEAFGVSVFMENDVRAAALGVHHQFQQDNLIYLNLGTGVAAAIVLNGRLFKGVSMSAGEVGHVPLHSTKRPLEETIAGPGIMRQAAELGLTIQHPGELYDLGQKGNEVAQHLISRVSNSISQTILWLIMSFDVETLFLGGGITKIGNQFLTPIMTSLATARTYSKLAELMVTDEKIKLLPADLNPGLLGAIHLARQADAKD